MKVWELLEKLAGADPDAVVAIAHRSLADAIVDQQECNPLTCLHGSHPSEMRMWRGGSVTTGLPVFVIEPGDPL